jgi:hypothetical protein
MRILKGAVFVMKLRFEHGCIWMNCLMCLTHYKLWEKDKASHDYCADSDIADEDVSIGEKNTWTCAGFSIWLSG